MEFDNMQITFRIEYEQKRKNQTLAVADGLGKVTEDFLGIFEFSWLR
jgi:hypothetical protein